MTLPHRPDHRLIQSRQVLTETPAQTVPDCVKWTVKTKHHNGGVERRLQVVRLPVWENAKSQRVDIVVTVHLCSWGRRAATVLF